MSLGKKTLALFLVLGLAICVGSYLALRVSVLPAFEEFEQRAAKESLSRVRSLLQSEIEALKILNLEYSAWDDTVSYMKDPFIEFEEENLSPGYWHSIDINMMLVFDTEGRRVYGWMSDSANGSGLDIDDQMLRPLNADDIIVNHATESNVVTGLIRTASGLMYIASYPILDTEAEGPIFGSLILGRLLDDELKEGLATRATTNLSIHIMGDSGLPPHVVKAFRDLPDSDVNTTIATYLSNVHGLEVMFDVYGDPAAVLEIRQLREISAMGADTIRTTMAFLGIGSLGFLLTALFLIRKLIVSPVQALTDKIVQMRTMNTLEFDAGNPRSDEVGVLASSFAELTSSLGKTREELEAARDEALSMSTAKSEFLARMSHEIRTPMNGVLGMTELLQNTQLDEKQERFARTIYGSAESLLHIINDILDISKIEAGKLELDIAPFDLRHMVEECLDLLAESAHRKDLELIGAFQADAHIFVEGDSLRLRQILINLLSNAVKFTQQGEIIVRVEEQEDDTESVLYRFAVEDTGVGIDPGNLEKIFEPFTQEDGSTTRRFGGTGLGLSICKQLVDLMQGEIGVESNGGRGCAFWFTVRLQKDSTQPELMGAEALAGRRVLIVDDNATNRETLQHQLESWKADVAAASSGAEALGVLGTSARKDKPFQAVLLDMNMPEMDGVQLAAAIRRLGHHEAVPLIMLSSVSAADVDEARNVGDIDAWLTKPVRQSRLLDALSSHLSRPRRAPTVTSDKPEGPRAINDNASGDLKVLLAEDNDVNRIVAVGMLNQLGHETTVVTNGQDAVDALKEQDFDLVLMDCQMPVLDGFKATLSIRRWEEEQDHAPTKIIALTANALSGDRERCLASGMDDYVSKPFTLEGLGAVIAEVMRRDPEPESSLPTQDDAGARVLVVDDNPVNQQVTKAMIGEMGYDAQIADDGDAALQAMRTTRFDMILMDCHMPVRDGYDTTREIRRLEEESSSTRIPIVAITADLMRSNRERCLDCGMDDYVTKPFTEGQLRHVLNRWLSGSPAQETSGSVDADGFGRLSETMTLASLDRHALEEILQLDSSPGKTMVRDIVVSYCALSTKLLLQLRSAIADHDAEQIELLAHSLKGSSGQVGAVLLTGLCEQILAGVRDDSLGNAAALCERAAVEHAAVIAALDRELQRLAA